MASLCRQPHIREATDKTTMQDDRTTRSSARTPIRVEAANDVYSETYPDGVTSRLKRHASYGELRIEALQCLPYIDLVERTTVPRLSGRSLERIKAIGCDDLFHAKVLITPKAPVNSCRFSLSYHPTHDIFLAQDGHNLIIGLEEEVVELVINDLKSSRAARHLKLVFEKGTFFEPDDSHEFDKRYNKDLTEAPIRVLPYWKELCGGGPNFDATRPLQIEGELKLVGIEVQNEWLWSDEDVAKFPKRIVALEASRVGMYFSKTEVSAGYLVAALLVAVIAILLWRR